MAAGYPFEGTGCQTGEKWEGAGSRWTNELRPEAGDEEGHDKPKVERRRDDIHPPECKRVLHEALNIVKPLSVCLQSMFLNSGDAHLHPSADYDASASALHMGTSKWCTDTREDAPS